jgi:hypothetical protein
MAENSFDRIHVVGILFLFIIVLGIVNGYKQGYLFNNSIVNEESTGKAKVEDTSWIPAGYTAYSRNSDVAWKWSADDSYTCSNGSCAQIEVVSKNGCDNLYAEASLLDASKNNVGYTNATTSSLQPMQKALLMFSSYNEDFQSFRLSKISCY